jgi:hypothetical protein
MKNVFVFLTIMILALNARAQDHTSKIPPLQFAKNKKVNNFTSSQKTNNTFLLKNAKLDNQNRAVQPFDNGVHYTTFFCKMELTMYEHCNMWIKVHAGDYDVYTKDAADR